jgi:hypothetical protein
MMQALHVLVSFLSLCATHHVDVRSTRKEDAHD